MKELLLLLALGIASGAPTPQKQSHSTPRPQKECDSQGIQTPSRDSSRERTLGREREYVNCVPKKK